MYWKWEKWTWEGSWDKIKGIWTENLDGSTQMYKLPQQEASFKSVNGRLTHGSAGAFSLALQGMKAEINFKTLSFLLLHT